MPAIIPSIRLDRDTVLSRFFTPYQLHWIHAEASLHSQGKQAHILAEKSVRIGWTFADAFKNVRKRLQYKHRDCLFATKDYPSALEYIRLCKKFAEVFNLASSIITHGEEYHKVPRLDDSGKPTAFTDEISMGVIKFHNGSRILAFSAHPQAMAVYGGDVGLDEFAKHQRPRLLWETAQGRIAWGGDIAIWSAHDGEDTLFNEFAQESRLGRGLWNLYYRITIVDAIELGLLEVINRTQNKKFSPNQFIADCRARSREEEVFQQAYMCNPLGAAVNHIVEWAAVERCRDDYHIERVHLEADDIRRKFGEFEPARLNARQSKIESFLHSSFSDLFSSSSSSSWSSFSDHRPPKRRKFRIGFDVAASGQGNLAAIYIDEAKSDDLWLSALFTCRPADWNFLKTVLFCFLREVRSLKAVGDESGLGRQICWEAAREFPGHFTKVNFSSKKHELGFGLMNQLANAEKHVRSEE